MERLDGVVHVQTFAKILVHIGIFIDKLRC